MQPRIRKTDRANMRFDPDFLAQVRRKAERDGRSLTWIAEVAFRLYLEDRLPLPGHEEGPAPEAGEGPGPQF